MKDTISKIRTSWRNACVEGHVRCRAAVMQHGSLIMFIAGACMIYGGLTEIARAGDPIEFNDFYVRRAVCSLYALIEGAFGALLTTIAGIGAIVGSAFGAYRAAIGLIVVSCGSFILRSLVSLFFGTLDNCGRSSTVYIRFPS